jgi:hypothetical protein
MEKIKCPIRQPKLQPHMTLQSFGKGIKQESEEGTSNQKSKKHQRSIYTQWFALHLWPHIHNVMEKHRSLLLLYTIFVHFIES